MVEKNIKVNYIHTYSFFVVCIEFLIECKPTNLRRCFPHHIEG